MNEIELVQGDASSIFKFQRKDAEGNVINTLPQKMWITFKLHPGSEKSLFQKTLESGIKYSEEDNYYRFQIMSEDTKDAPYGVYGFDIAILNEVGEKKTLFNNGVLKIVEHYTHKQDEV